MNKVSGYSSYDKGIDVSKWQGIINWKKVADSGIKHVFIKMSEGGTFADPRFEKNYNNAHREGIKVNCYHYFRGASSTPQQQFDNIKNNLSSVDFDSSRNLLAIDVENRSNDTVTPEQMADNLYSLLNLISQSNEGSSENTLIYCSPTYWDSFVKWDKYDFSIYPLWVAHWDVETPRIPLSWKNACKSWSWWQYSSKGKVDGIIGNVVDLNWVKTP